MSCGRCASTADAQESSGELQGLALCLDLFPVLAFVTDRYNRIVRVNRTFANTIGDPIVDQLP